MGEAELDTEQKIKEAAKRVFLEYGFEGAKIRQIAEAADVNIALVNYYFRSKEQLFNSIYRETFAEFVGKMMVLLNEKTPLEVKIWKIVDRYTDFILENQMMPAFILTQQRKEGAAFFKDLDVRSVIQGSYFWKQLQEASAKGEIRAIDPLQVVISVMGSIIFPIMAGGVLSYVGTFDEKAFREFIEARKKIIPEMIMTYLRAG